MPEIDDESDDRPNVNENHAGVDDGLLGDGDDNNGAGRTDPDPRRGAGAKSPLPDRGRRPSFSFPGYYGNGPTTTIDGVEVPIPDVNAYQHKKTLAQGMMDLALLSANANQLRYVLETGRLHPYFYPSLIFISMSILLQVSAGVVAHSSACLRTNLAAQKNKELLTKYISDSLLIFRLQSALDLFGMADIISRKKRKSVALIRSTITQLSAFLS